MHNFIQNYLQWWYSTSSGIFANKWRNVSKTISPMHIETTQSTYYSCPSVKNALKTDCFENNLLFMNKNSTGRRIPLHYMPELQPCVCIEHNCLSVETIVISFIYDLREKRTMQMFNERMRSSDREWEMKQMWQTTIYTIK